MSKFSSLSYLAPNRYERVLNHIAWSLPIVRSAFSGSSRATRLSCNASDQHQQILWNTGANVIGPLYTAFVWWLLQHAKAAGIKRLYFMARDGHVLKEIADHLMTTAGFAIQTKYLYVSRQSLLYASIVDIDNFDIRWLMWNPVMPLSAKTIRQRLDIPPDVVQEELKKYHITNIKRPLSLPEKWKFRKFFKEPAVQTLILARARSRYETTVAYLRQEGLTEDVPFALVDLGWLAQSQYALSRILEKNGSRPSNGVTGFYLGTNWLLWKYRNDQVQSFLFHPSNLVRQMPLIQYELPEIFATVDHGRTLGYKTDNNQITPILAEPSQAAAAWGSKIQKESVLAFVQELVKTLPREYWQRSSPSAKIGKIFDLFCNWPSKDEAEAYGRFQHGADIEEKEGQEIAPVISGGELPRIYRGYYWVQGSIRRSRLFLAPVFIGLFGFINLVRHLVLIFISKTAFPKGRGL